VVAAHDRVILMGNVQAEDDKRRVETRAAQAAGGWKIDNQLRIAGTIDE
jgi:osmotically-inducible protein OsmY